MTQPEQILAALEAAGGELTYPQLLGWLRERTSGPEGVTYPVQQMVRDGKLEAIDGGHPERRPWVFEGWCDCCEPDCRFCMIGPLVLRLRPRGERIARNLLRSSYA